MCKKGDHDSHIYRTNHSIYPGFVLGQCLRLIFSSSASLISSLPLPRQAFEGQLAWDSNPLYVLMHESIYCQGGVASNWAAHRVRAEPEFDSKFDAVKATREGEDCLSTVDVGQLGQYTKTSCIGRGSIGRGFHIGF